MRIFHGFSVKPDVLMILKKIYEIRSKVKVRLFKWRIYYGKFLQSRTLPNSQCRKMAAISSCLRYLSKPSELHNSSSPTTKNLSIFNRLPASLPRRHFKLTVQFPLKPPSVSSLFIKPHKPLQHNFCDNSVKCLFTGIVEEMGTVKNLGFDQNNSFTVKIQAKVMLEDIHLGDSISINGTCLTVTEFDNVLSEFCVGL
ncbi:uncharacterized protein LOC111387269, partial [Olea europaea var. sylvestris]|uniref:uncharacterized protein LOC111387269 n=1 Tax=Olea europaea var. sylvestris TaxID=158386 RepID=UPI000C1D5267